jgi:hypothetical protein
VANLLAEGVDLFLDVFTGGHRQRLYSGTSFRFRLPSLGGTAEAAVPT